MKSENNSSPSLASDVTREEKETETEEKKQELSEEEKQKQFELIKNRLTRSS